MSKMGQELEQKLDENKYELYEALQYIICELDQADVIKANSIFMEFPNRVLAKIEGAKNG